MAGYSGTPLVKKLGIKPGSRLCVIDAPPGYARTLGPLPDGVRPVRTLARTLALDCIQLFITRRAQLERRFGSLVRALAPDGMLWVSWPKKAAKVPTDVTEDVIRGIALANGLVDVKVCAVDDVWSGLKLVRRLEDRR